jgi:D-alanyl-lipoteichoic acid acyltransferase DltB (MBOAT superfamily)
VLFNSYEFLFGFLPATLIGFFLLGRLSRGLALGWLVAASLAFYAWWRPLNVFIIAPSIAINYLLARALLVPDRGERARRTMLIAGIVFNVAFLGYFKYTNFLTGVVHDLTGTQIFWRQVILPLGISFITFQKIAFLVDVHARRVTDVRFGQYLLFVLFFPQLIAGPIVHYRELMPQFERVTGRFDGTHVAVGVTLLGIGLFKKVVLADGMAAHVSPLYQAAAAGGDIPLMAAWMAAIGFTLQIYFDFSGYSDMALGAARCVGVRLPANFDSPLKASSIIEFWARWHMTLTRFLAAYLYNPLVLWLNRRRMARGLPAAGGRRTPYGAFLQVLAFPTLVTMAISGLWHGAGYTFVVWGLLHGVYLVANHAWRFYGPKRDKSAPAGRLASATGFLITFTAVAVAMVLFRAPTMASAAAVLKGMVGVSGVGLPAALVERLGSLGGIVPALASGSAFMSMTELAGGAAWLTALLAIAWLCPNSLEIMGRYEPAIGLNDRRAAAPRFWERLQWNPSLAWAVAMGAVLVIVVFRLGPESEFLYWQF